MNKKLQSETLLYGLGRYGSNIATLLTTCVLSRLLTPDAYGTVAVTVVFTNIFTVISDLGINTAVIQDKTLTDDEINDLFSFSVYFSFILAVIFALLGYPISRMYHNPEYVRICALLSIGVFFTSLNSVPAGVLMRHKQFRVVGLRLITLACVLGVVAVVLAYLGFGLYTLVLQNILFAVCVFLWHICNVNLRFKPRFRIASVKKIFSYSSNQFAYSIVNYLESNFDSFLIGKSLGSVSLAYYDKGYRLMMYPVQNLTHVISPILHPILSDYQNDLRFIYEAYLKVVRILSLLGIYIAAVCFFAAGEIILFFFGDQWHASIPLFRILALSVWPQMVSASTAAIYRSTGNTKLMFRSSVIHFSAAAVLIVLGVMSGSLEAVALCVTLSLYLRFFIDYYFLVARNFRYSYAGFLGTFAKDAVIAAMLAAAVAALTPHLGTGGFGMLVVKAAALLAVFAAGVVLTGQHRLIKKRFTRRA